VRALQRREQLLAGLVEERTRELASANEELRLQARLDGLTGIANYRSFREFFDSEWRRCRRGGLPLSVIMIDIDHFKPYNDHYGHQHGDIALQRVADIVQGASRRPGDLAARYGGEEFIVVLTDTDSEGASDRAESIREAVWEAEIPHATGGFGRITVSAGTATIVPVDELDQMELVGRADDALYRAKEGGRNRVESAG
jgi:diguanylate cyclase (GGDEF)-like protein